MFLYKLFFKFTFEAHSACNWQMFLNLCLNSASRFLFNCFLLKKHALTRIVIYLQFTWNNRRVEKQVHCKFSPGVHLLMIREGLCVRGGSI